MVSSILANDGYYVAYEPITLSFISVMFIKKNYYHSCVMFPINSISICNDLVNNVEIIKKNDN